MAKQKSPVSAEKLREPAAPVKLGYNEARELNELPSKIEILEREQVDITRRLCSPAIYHDCPDEARSLQERLAIIETELMNHLARWEELEAKCSARGQKI